MQFGASRLVGAGIEQLEGVQQPQNSNFPYGVKAKFSVLPETEVDRLDLKLDLNSLWSVYIEKPLKFFKSDGN